MRALCALRFLPLAHPREFCSTSSHRRFVALWVGCVWAQGTIATHHKMRLYVVGLEHLSGKGDSIFLAEFFARADVDVNLAVFGPGVQTDVALGDDDKAGETSIQRIRRFNV